MLGMLGDKKKMVQLILNETPKKNKDVPQGLEGDFSPALEAYAGDMIASVGSGDAKAFASALKEFISACEQEEEYQAPADQVGG